MHPVVLILRQTPQSELQVRVGLDPGSQDDLDGNDVEELPQEVEHHRQQKRLSQGEGLLRQVQIVRNDAPSESQSDSTKVSSNASRMLPDEVEGERGEGVKE